jgi:HEPN domain-containing protein
VTLAEPVVVLGALTTELFLKCLISIETGKASHGHDLKELFDELSPETRARIERAWDNDIVPLRNKEWDDIERFGLEMPRDLPSELVSEI